MSTRSRQNFEIRPFRIAVPVDEIDERKRRIRTTRWSSAHLGMSAAAAQSGAVEGMPSSTLVSRTFSTPRHTTHYVERGPADGPLMIFLHGWPSISLMWRAQIDAFAADGWHCVAPDLRGYGGSFAPAGNDGYTIQEVVADMAELHGHLGGKPAIWVGHDWGSAVASELVAHEPKRSRGVVLISLAYQPEGHALQTIVPLVDRTIYPADSDPALWPPADFDVLVQAFEAHGFRPACAWYLNDDANIAYAREAPNGGRLSQPVLFVNGDFDQICSTTGNRQGDPMRAACADLTVTSMPAGHWLPLELEAELIQAIRTWLQRKKIYGGTGKVN